MIKFNRYIMNTYLDIWLVSELSIAGDAQHWAWERGSIAIWKCYIYDIGGCPPFPPLFLASTAGKRWSELLNYNDYGSGSRSSTLAFFVEQCLFWSIGEWPSSVFVRSSFRCFPPSNMQTPSSLPSPMLLESNLFLAGSRSHLGKTWRRLLFSRNVPISQRWEHSIAAWRRPARADFHGGTASLPTSSTV